MRPMTVRFSHTHRSASHRRSNFVATPVNKKTASTMSLVEKKARQASTSSDIVIAA